MKLSYSKLSNTAMLYNYGIAEEYSSMQKALQSGSGQLGDLQSQARTLED
jgi:hypothetical protein